MSEKVTATVIIKNPNGLHARPAALFVQTCNRFLSDVEVTCGSLTVNGKNILGIMTLGAAAGSSITISAIGDDAQDAINTLMRLVDDNFDEPL